MLVIWCLFFLLLDKHTNGVVVNANGVFRFCRFVPIVPNIPFVPLLDFYFMHLVCTMYGLSRGYLWVGNAEPGFLGLED